MMIDGEIGERTIHTLVKTQDEVRENNERGLTGILGSFIQYLFGIMYIGALSRKKTAQFS